MVAILDYGVGNTGSIVNMFKRIGVKAEATANPNRILAADKLVLPGVGAFDTAAERLERSGLRPLLHHKVIEERIPLLGICLGMQLLMEGSDEGKLPGLGWIRGRTRSFASLRVPGLKVPHMGWNDVKIARPSPLLDNFEAEMRFYFVHSYYVECSDPGDVVLTCNYGTAFHAAVQRENIFGAQFHPEKSHRFGMRLLQNFAAMQLS
jgi:glutamine amidotransferase